MPLPHPSRPPEELPRGRWLLAALALLVVLWAAQAVYSAVQEFRAQYLSSGLKR